MALMHIPLERIEQNHLQALIDAQAAESRNIEYKRETYGGNDAARAEYLADVSSFANTLGGDLIIGMAASAGVPKAFAPFSGNADAELLRLEQMARDGLEPRIANLGIRAVAIPGGATIVVRVPRSYSLPHRIIFQRKNRFWARSSAGKFEPTVEELRAMFTQAPTLVERIRNFRQERIQAIRGGNAPVQLFDPVQLILHVVPFSHFEFGARLSIADIEGDRDAFQPLLGLTADWRVNFDGFLTLTRRHQDAERYRAYVQIFRTGAVEAVDSSILRSDDGIDIRKIDATIVRYARAYSAGLHQYGIDPPLAVMASLINIKGYNLITNADNIFGIEKQAADRGDLHLAPVLLEEVPSTEPQCGRALQPLLDQLWNAAGVSSAKSFNEAGEYVLLR